MPKATPLQSSFNTGQISPLMQGRVENERYKAGMAYLKNYIPMLQGPLCRKPGSKYVVNVKDSTKPPVLIPFTFTTTQNYNLEFGDKYIRFYSNQGQVVVPPATTLYQLLVLDGGFAAQHGFQGARNGYAVRPTSTSLTGELFPPALVTSLGAGTPMELQSPYAYADVPNIRFRQNANVIYLTHPNYPVFKLIRYDVYSWELRQVSFYDGPYLPRNTYINTADNVVTTLTANNVSGGILTTGPQATVNGTSVGTSNYVRISTSAAHGYTPGMNVTVRGVGGTTEANNTFTPSGSYYWSILVIDSTHFDLIGCTYVHAWTSGGQVNPALWLPDANGNYRDTFRLIRLIQPVPSGIILSPIASTWIIVSVIDPSQASAGPSSNQGTLYALTPIVLWNMGAYYSGPTTALQNNPSCVEFHQDRLFLAGAPNQPQDINASQPGDYENFAATQATDLSVTNSNALQFTLNSIDINVIRWLKTSNQGLLAGTASSEWTISPSSANEALTPTNFNAVQSSFWGSFNTDAVTAGNSVLHIQRAQRKVRELNFYYQLGNFRSSDLTELSDSLTLPSILKLVSQKETQGIIWAQRGDGSLGSMTYNRDDLTLKVGWSQHYLGGQSDSAGSTPSVYSMSVIPSQDTTYDQLWLIVKRYINGATVYTVEYLTKIFDDTIRQDDAFHFDCGVSYDNPFNIAAVTQGSTTKITTATAHGFSVGDQVRFQTLNGLNTSTVDLNGNISTKNLLNEKVFTVATIVDTFNFTIAVSSTGATPYVPNSMAGGQVPAITGLTGQVRKLVSTITGLTWLIGETVGVYTDGADHPPCVVSGSGSITLSYPAAKVQIGYAYNSDAQNLRLDAGAADGTSIGKTRRPARVAFMLYRTSNLQIGPSFTDLVPINFERADVNNFDTATPLYSGIQREPCGNGYDYDGQVCFRQNGGGPGMVQALAVFMEEQDV